MGHAVAWFGTPEADGGVRPERCHNRIGTNAGCPGSSVFEADPDADGGDGVVQIMGAPEW
jgi:hypothetical protein